MSTTSSEAVLRCGFGRTITGDYLNWRGERAVRTCSPMAIRHGVTEWHPEPGWLLRAIDSERGAEREFSLADMTPATGTEIVLEAGQRIRLAGPGLADGGEDLAPGFVVFREGGKGATWFLACRGPSGTRLVPLLDSFPAA